MEVIDTDWIKARLSGKRGELARLARAMRVKPDIVTKILSGVRRVQPEEMPRVLAFFEGPNPQAVTPETGTEFPAMIDVYDVRASAGNGSMIDHEEVVDRLSFPPDYLRRLTRTAPRHLAIIGVKGDSMDPTLKDDDLVMLDTSKTSLDFDGLFVLRFGDALHVKRIGRATNGSVRVISDNSAIYPPIEMPRAEVQVVGKVIWLGKKV